MMSAKPVIKMPEFFVFVRLFIIGFAGAEVWHFAFYLGTGLATALSQVAHWAKACAILLAMMLCLMYTWKRSGHAAALRIASSARVDLLFVIVIGVWANELVSPLLSKPHLAIQRADPYWGAVVLSVLCAMLLSALLQEYWPRAKKAPPQLYFIADEEIEDKSEDLLASAEQARSFAETVLASVAHVGLVFGVDGPWGVGKTSFINLAQRYWEGADSKVIVCRFEPLRYASEPDLADRLIQDLTAAIRRKVFVPELRPAATRYSRLIKGKADVSFLGFKLSLEPSQESVDDLLDDIDEVLKRIDRRVIIVIDDLDRLDVKTINNVLFTTRRTFKLSQATYVLCYDTEILASSKEEGARAREFLEKFITVKLSLFVDSSNIQDFLRRDWQRVENQLGSIPSDTMLKLGAVLNELANILDGDLAAHYLPFVGDMRKVKRFVNAMLLMQLDKSDLGRTDFNKGDLIHLILLHLTYPGLFRRIYAEETEGRRGSFSVRREFGEQQFKNSPALSTIMLEQSESAGFLLKQLFDVEVLELDDGGNIEEAVLSSRACFNQESARNLEGYLKLIVRFATPEPQNTFILYQSAVDRVLQGASVTSVLTSTELGLAHGEHVHDQFWRVLVNRSYEFNTAVAEDAINTIVDCLPRYSAVRSNDLALRQRSVYSLLRLLDRAGWGRAPRGRLPNTVDNVIEIAWRIFGERGYEGRGLLRRLVSSDRGVLGWSDLMLFRLQCSADRQGQLYNIQSALIAHHDRNAPTTGLVSNLALMGMRNLSQEIFALFKQTYIDVQRNFYAEVNDTPAEAFVGEATLKRLQSVLDGSQIEQASSLLDQGVAAARSTVKSFVIYQLSNSIPPNGSGVGCGYYDESGTADTGGISRVMNEYIFGVCFNPDINNENAYHFLDHCLAHLSNSFFSGGAEEGYSATRADLPGGLDAGEMGRYWRQHRVQIRQLSQSVGERYVITSNYVASYREDLERVFTILDGFAREVEDGELQRMEPPPD
ncbi:KAP family NTPase [Massilia varians]|uniref:KAP family NTPase n=1 Tax=Massilia varians TaxID=457921 RepID=UPI002553443F|nr:KAP family NTPase [Massilia varians]MDK6078213.1 KAP family NTPase [Massilia varians]